MNDEPIKQKPVLRVPKKKWHGPCIYKVKEILSPRQQEHRGYRFLVAMPNMAGHEAFSSAPAPSFQKPFLQFQGGDWTIEELEKRTAGAIRWLLNRGFTTVEEGDIYKQRMLIAMSKGKTTHKEREDE